jgi:hypothetical protein
MSEQARAAIGSETIEAVADRGYYTGQARDRSPAATLGRPPMSPAAAGWEPVDRRQCMGPRQPNETIFADGEVVPQQTAPIMFFHQTTGIRSCCPASSVQFTAISSKPPS